MWCDNYMIVSVDEQCLQWKSNRIVAQQLQVSTCFLQPWAVSLESWWTWRSRWGPEALWAGGGMTGRLGNCLEWRSPKRHCCLGRPDLFSSGWQQDWGQWYLQTAPRHYRSYLREETNVEEVSICVTSHMKTKQYNKTGTGLEYEWNYTGKETSAINCHCSRDETIPRVKKSGFSSSPRENSKLIGLSPIFLSIMVASNNAPNSRKLSMLSVSSWTQKRWH